MTLKRFDNHSTEFGLWLREQTDIASSLGFVATNIDFFWKNYKTEQFMLIEEKRHMTEPKEWQHKIFIKLHQAFKTDPNYHGFHLLQFENTSPDDGKIYIDRKEVTKEQLIEFLEMKQ